MLEACRLTNGAATTDTHPDWFQEWTNLGHAIWRRRLSAMTTQSIMVAIRPNVLEKQLRRPTAADAAAAAAGARGVVQPHE